MAFFGSFQELRYRVDIKAGPGCWLRLRTNSGPGFSLVAERADDDSGLRIVESGPGAEVWLSDQENGRLLRELLSVHFSRMEVRPELMDCFSYPAERDIMPEGRQISYCLSLLYRLWQGVPAEQRRAMRVAQFID